MAEIRDYRQLAASSQDPMDFSRAIDSAVAAAPLLMPIDRTNRDQVIWRQTELKNMGADIVVDGVWGPVTEWYEAMANNGDLKPPAPGSAPAASAPAAPVRAAAPAAAATPQPVAYTPPSPRTTPKPLPADWMSQAREQFPVLAGLLNIPEVASVAMEALQWEWPADKIVARLANTEWYKSTPAAARQWIGLKGSDPASAQRMIDENKANLRDLADKYGIDMSDDVLARWAEDTLSGKVLQDGFQKELVNLAKGRFPGLAAQLDQGLTVDQAFDPYRALAAKELELPATSISVKDPKWSRALENRDEKGVPLVMTLYDWQKTLRTDASYGWDRTSGARAQAADFTQRLAQTFGKA